MASTTLSNINFLSDAFKDRMAGEFTHKLGFLTSGVAVNMGDNAFVTSDDKGEFANIPKWDTLSGSFEQITTSSSTTINNLSDVKDRAVWLEREVGFGSNQLVRVVSAADPTSELARQAGQYLASELHRYLMLVRAGVFGSALATTHSTGSTYSAATITNEGGLAAKQKLGDNQDVLSVFLCNSKVKQDLIKDKIATYDRANPNTLESGDVLSWLGCNVNATDKLTATSSVYPSYFAAPGSMLFKFRNRPQQALTNANQYVVNAGGIIAEFELNRESKTAGGQDEVIMRTSFMTHIPGVKWNSATSNPTDAQFSTTSNWTKVYNDDKLIKIVELKTA